MTDEFFLRGSCRMCEGTDLVRAMTLTPTPPGNNFVRQEDLQRPENRYPLELYFCRGCHHVQLGHVVDPAILYQNDYLYVSGTSGHFVRHLQEYAADAMDRFALRPGALVADIGSNDGTCLRGFRDLGMTVLGVDPASGIAGRATAAGIPTVPAFFSEALARDLRKRHGPADLITSHNACAHIDRLDDVMRGVAHWLDDDGVFVVEVGYFVDVLTKLSFDTIYHEHLDFHTVEPFERLFARTGLEMISVRRIEPQGGSIRVMAQKAGGRLAKDRSACELMDLERSIGLHDAATISAYGDRIAELGGQLRTLLRSLKADGKSVAAYGAPTKSTTLLLHFGIGAESLDFIVDDNPMKVGLYSPVSHIPIRPTDEIYSRRPDYVLILAWNFAESIMKMHARIVEQGSRFVLPMPEPQIV